MTEFETKVLESLDAIQTLLEALLGDCEATKTLADRRAKNAERMRRVRAQTPKEKTKDEERDIPPTPPIEKEAEKRKELSLARAREESVDSTGQTYFPGMLSEEEAKRIEEERQAEIERQNREIFEGESKKYFDAWWKLYPKKESKQPARKKLLELLEAKFKKGGMKAVDEFMGVIFKSTHEWIGSELWNRNGKKFICHPSTWLDQERYLDSPDKNEPYTHVKRITENQNCIVDYSDRPI